MQERDEGKHYSAASVHLDAIRGTAAMVVLLGHTRDLFFPSLSGQVHTGNAHTNKFTHPWQHPPTTGHITVGDEAVMVFFVLSGYLVGGSVVRAVRKQTWSWKPYLAKRMTRLWIVLLPALLLGVALDFAGIHLFSSPASIYAGPAQQSVVPVDVARRLSPVIVGGNAVFLQQVFVDTAGTNDSLWSLANEFWYYIAFPFFVLATRAQERWWMRLLYGLALAGVIALVGPNITLLFFIWIVGAAVACLELRFPPRLALYSSIAAALLLPVVCVYVRRVGMPIYAAEWIVAVYFACLLYLIAHQTAAARANLYRSVSGFFSRMSYTLYLVHVPVAVFLCACINRPWHHWSMTPKNVAIFLGYNAVILLAAYGFYLLFEKNTDRLREVLFPRDFDRKPLGIAAD